MKTKNKRSILYNVIAIFVVFRVIGLNAQITIDQNDMPSPGDTVRISTALNLEGYNFEETGEDHTWDYSGLLPVAQSVDTFKSVTETPVFYWPFFLFSANLASPLLGDFPIPGIPLTDVYSFYNNESSGFYDEGFAATLYGIPLPFKYNDPDRFYAFPMNYGDVDSSVSGFQYGLTDLGYIMVEKKRVNSVDGWGTLITPYGTFEVLRQKSVVDEYDSLYLDSLNAGVPVNRHYIEYKWMAVNGKIPVLKVTDSFLNFVVEFVDSARVIFTAVDESRFVSDDFKVYPNPVRNVFTLSFQLKPPEGFVVELYSMSGIRIALLTKQGKSKGVVKIKFNLNDYQLAPGVYLISVRSGKTRLTKQIIYNP